MKQKYKATYDEDGDTLTVYQDARKVKESIEVSDDLIIDVDSYKNIIGFELLDAYKFLHTLNEKISKNMLCDIRDVELNFKNYRNYLVIILTLKHNNELIEEKLPAFVNQQFKSPLIASVST